MKVKTIAIFKDLKAKKLREVGEEFICSRERYEEILKKGKFVEPVEERKTEKTTDVKVKKTKAEEGDL